MVDLPYYRDATPAVLRAWLTTRDHKRIGLMFLLATLCTLALGGLFALLLRVSLLAPSGALLDGMTYNRLFTLHGIVMVWLFMIPAIPAAFGNFMLPLMLGAQDVAFPRLNLISFYIYVFGAFVTLGAMLWGGADTGWTFYTPYSSMSPTAVAPMVTTSFGRTISSSLSSHGLQARISIVFGF